jgi:hypothetical protein
VTFDCFPLCFGIFLVISIFDLVGSLIYQRSIDWRCNGKRYALVIGILTLAPKYSIAELAPRQNGYGQDHFPDQLVWLTIAVFFLSLHSFMHL